MREPELNMISEVPMSDPLPGAQRTKEHDALTHVDGQKVTRDGEATALKNEKAASG